MFWQVFLIPVLVFLVVYGATGLKDIQLALAIFIINLIQCVVVFLIAILFFPQLFAS